MNVNVPLSSQVVRLCGGQEVEFRGQMYPLSGGLSMIMGGNESFKLARKGFQSLFSD